MFICLIATFTPLRFEWGGCRQEIPARFPRHFSLGNKTRNQKREEDSGRAGLERTQCREQLRTRWTKCRRYRSAWATPERRERSWVRSWWRMVNSRHCTRLAGIKPTCNVLKCWQRLPWYNLFISVSVTEGAVSADDLEFTTENREICPFFRRLHVGENACVSPFFLRRFSSLETGNFCAFQWRFAIETGKDRLCVGTAHCHNKTLSKQWLLGQMLFSFAIHFFTLTSYDRWRRMEFFAEIRFRVSSV